MLHRYIKCGGQKLLWHYVYYARGDPVCHNVKHNELTCSAMTSA